MSGVNKVILVGHLGKDPEVRVFESGQRKVTFTLATSEYYKDKDGNRVQITDWHNIVCWRNLAENAERYLTKGKLIYLEGKIKTRSWEDNGVKKYFTEIEANTFNILSARNEDEDKPTATKVEPTQSVQPAPPVIETSSETELVTDDLPF